MGQRPKVRRDPDFKAHVGDRIAAARSVPPRVRDRTQVARGFDEMVRHLLRGMRIDPRTAEARAMRREISDIFRDFLGVERGRS